MGLLAVVLAPVIVLLKTDGRGVKIQKNCVITKCVLGVDIVLMEIWQIKIG